MHTLRSLAASSGAALAVITPLSLAAQETQAPPALLSPSGGLIFWTFIIFVALLFILGKFAYPKILGAVEARERALEQAIEAAKRDREEAAKALAEYKRQLDAAREEVQTIIAEGRGAGEKVRTDIVARAHEEQNALLTRAKQEIASERDRAIAELRREAVDLALAGASKVIEKNLDDPMNRKLVESYLSSLSPTGKN